ESRSSSGRWGKSCRDGPACKAGQPEGEVAMLRRKYRSGPRRRRGIILLVVLAFLTLFAVVGLTFVFYADSQATSARAYREAQSLTRPDLDPELLLAYFLGQLIYDCPDDAGGVYSALRGHSLARLMYGFDDGGRNAVPFNGAG